MMSQSDTILGGLQAVFATMIGGKVGVMAADAVELPVWAQYVLGPFGALLGMVAAVWWLSQRLTRADKRLEQRDETYIALLERVTACTTQNSEALHRAASALESNAEVIAHCRNKIRE